jgi:exo-beta-1,3-glucanase (GH17 family)
MKNNATFLIALATLLVTMPRADGQQKLTNLVLRVQGLCYGPFRNGQNPTGVYPTSSEISADLGQLKPPTQRVRTYSVFSTLVDIPGLAGKRGLQCYAGAWVGTDTNANQVEIQRLLRVAHRSKPAALIVGNEVLYSGNPSVEELTNLIKQVKAATTLPVGSADTWDEWLEHPEVADVVDVLLVHIHPYHDGVSVKNAAQHVYRRWQEVKNTYTKTVVIGETGWPTAGDTKEDAVPSEENLCRFLHDFVTLATASNVPYFLFEAYDEQWKQEFSGVEVEAHWGLLTTNRVMKPCVRAFFDSPPPLIEIQQAARCGAIAFSPTKISGNIYGLPVKERSKYRVIIYAYTNAWYIQPLTFPPYTRINGRGMWTSRTHMGSKYAALLVKQNYLPSSTLGALPEVGGDVLAISVAECATK